MADAKISSFASHGTPVGADYVASILASGPTNKQLLLSDARDYTNMLYSASSADANIALAINTLHVVDISGYTADRTATLPGTAAVGDRVGLALSVGDTAFELLITATAGDTLNGIAGGTEWSRLFIIYEVVIMRCIVANTTWVVEYDGRIPMKAVIRLSTSPDGETAATYTYPTAAATPGAWTADIDNGSLTDVTTDKITFRRACKSIVVMTAVGKDAWTDQQYLGLFWELNGTTLTAGQTVYASGTSQPGGAVLVIRDFATGDYIRYKYRTQAGSLGLLSSASVLYSSLQICEVL